MMEEAPETPTMPWVFRDSDLEERFVAFSACIASSFTGSRGSQEKNKDKGRKTDVMSRASGKSLSSLGMTIDQTEPSLRRAVPDLVQEREAARAKKPEVPSAKELRRRSLARLGGMRFDTMQLKPLPDAHSWVVKGPFVRYSTRNPAPDHDRDAVNGSHGTRAPRARAPRSRAQGRQAAASGDSAYVRNARTRVEAKIAARKREMFDGRVKEDVATTTDVATARLATTSAAASSSTVSSGE